MSQSTLRKLAAFATDPSGGNPAGVWVGDELPDPGAMQDIARRVGFSETAFVAPQTGTRRIVRYFSPEAEVTFCGHATVAAGVVLGESSGPDRYWFDTAEGPVDVDVAGTDRGLEVSFTSVEPSHQDVATAVLDEALAALGWDRADLDTTIGPVVGFAGAHHLILGVSSRGHLRRLEYDFDRLRDLMLREGWTTVHLVWRESDTEFHARNPFPVGGVVEDPATGAAAAAFGGYLRDAGLVEAPRTITIHQGDDMGRPSIITVSIPSTGGIVVTGTAADIE